MTPFGKAMRNLRMEKGLLLGDLADLVGCSASYISSLEFGRKRKPPAPFVQKVCKLLNLSENERAELEEAAKNSSTTITLQPKMVPLAYEIGNVFARKAPEFPEEKLRRIRELMDE